MHWSCFLLAFLGLVFPLWGCIYPDETEVASCLRKIEKVPLSSGLEGIDCIYVINLDQRKEKWERMRSLLAERGLQAVRFSAINGWAIPLDLATSLVGPYPPRMIGGKMGCLLSHVSIFKDAYERGFSRVWILEDDVDFIEEVTKIPPLLKDLSNIDPEWDIFYTDVDSKNGLGVRIPSLDADFHPDRRHLPLSYYRRKARVHPEIDQIRQRFGCYSYILSLGGIEKALSYFTHVYIWTPIDIDIHYIPKIRQYAANRDLVSIWFQCPISDNTYRIDEE
jgi:hypothetical protein